MDGLSNKWNVVYIKETGLIYEVFNAFQDVRSYYRLSGCDFLDSIDYITVEDKPIGNLNHYRVSNGSIWKLSEIEIDDITRYGRLLSHNERFEFELLNKLKPSYDEIKKAENTIETLTLLREAMTNE